MPSIPSFHEVSFPSGIALGASGGPMRKTEIVQLGSGREKRNARWAFSRRKFDAGLGVRNLDDLHEVLSFFEARGGRLFGFRFRDPLDWKSCSPGATPSFDDQLVGTGDGVAKTFQLVKNYGQSPPLEARPIAKPVEGSVLVGVSGRRRLRGTHFSVDHATGEISFRSAPPSGASVTAGFEFDMPARFDSDEIKVSLSAFEAGDVPDIPVVEILP